MPLVGEEVVYMGKGHAEVIEELGRVIRGGTKKGGRDVDMVGCSSFSFVQLSIDAMFRYLAFSGLISRAFIPSNPYPCSSIPLLRPFLRLSRLALLSTPLRFVR